MAGAEAELEPVAELAADPVAASAAPRSPAPADAPPEAGSKKSKKSKKSKGEPAPETDPGAPSIAAHPRAARSVARAKAWGGLVGFALGGYLSLPTHTVADAGLRALLAGVVSYVVVWAGSIFVWRRLVMLEIKAREQQLLAAAAPRPPGLPARAGSAGREQLQ